MVQYSSNGFIAVKRLSRLFVLFIVIGLISPPGSFAGVSAPDAAGGGIDIYLQRTFFYGRQ